MRLRELLMESEVSNDYEIIDEKPFDTLALCGAQIPGRVCTFIDDSRYTDLIANNVSMVITSPEIGKTLDTCRYGLALMPQPRVAFFMLHNYLSANEEYARKSEKSIIADSAQISPLAFIASENVYIGENVTIEPYVTIYSNVRIGNNTIIRSGARIGGEGYEYKRLRDGILSVKHLGGVKIGENVEIQNNTCVDKAVYPWDDTVIEDYVKIDNLVHVAHGVKIGKNTMIVANSGIGGRTEIGADTWIGLGATIRNGIAIGNNARVNMGAVVTKPVEDASAVSGNFAIEHHMFIEQMKRNIKKTNE